MARPKKAGLDYFPLDANQDYKIDLVFAKYGAAGFGILIDLWTYIYKEGYYLKVTPERLILFSNKYKVTIPHLEEFLSDSLKWELFSQKLYDNYNILTSNGIQKRYIEATKRRIDITFISEFILVSRSDFSFPDKVNVHINSINDNINPTACGINANSCDINEDNVSINPQSKVKKSIYISDSVPESGTHTLPSKKKKTAYKFHGKELILTSPEGVSFLKFWKAYGNKVDKADTAKLFTELYNSDEWNDDFYKKLIQGAESQNIKNNTYSNGFKKSPKTFLSSRNFEDGDQDLIPKNEKKEIKTAATVLIRAQEKTELITDAIACFSKNSRTCKPDEVKTFFNAHDKCFHCQMAKDNNLTQRQPELEIIPF